MIQAGSRSRFPLESSLTIRVARNHHRQHLDGDLPLKLRVASAIAIARGAGAERAKDLKSAEAVSHREAGSRRPRVALFQLDFHEIPTSSSGYPSQFSAF